MKKAIVGILIIMLLITGTTLNALSVVKNTNDQIISLGPSKEITDWNPGDDYKMHFPQLPDPFGWDVDATYVEGVFPYNCLADDWMCSESGPVSDIHFWGSWFNDIIGTIIAFNVAIATDIPVDPPSILYSRPGITLWERTFYPGEWIVAGPWEGPQGWYDRGEGFYLPDNHVLYWQYNIEHIEDPFIQEAGTIYWLSISAIILPDPPQPRWGWKSSLNHWNDDAVHGYWYELDWVELYEPPLFETSLDLAFVITGDGGIENNPPNTPSKPNGPTSATEGTQYTYTTTTTDIDGDQVKYGFDFDNDGVINPSHWTGYLNSGTICSVKITFSGTGTRYMRVKAEDTHGAQSGFSSALTVVVSGANNPPETPDTPSGPSTGNTGISLSYNTTTTDADGDSIKYGWDWDGDGTVDEWSNFLSSGSIDTRSHVWTSAGTYYIQVMAEDSDGGQSAFSAQKSVVITSNNPPVKPTISGPSSGRIGRAYTYSSTTTDPESDQIYFWFDWADGTNTGWVGPYNSGDTVSMSHTWSNKGSYSLKVKAKDISGEVSVWSDPLGVSMPKSNLYLSLIEERFPILFNLLSSFSFD